MSFEVLNDFKFHSAVSAETIEKYKDSIPPGLLEIWTEYGYGTFLNGYFKIINPDDFRGILDESFFDSDVSIPIFATGLSDLITWRKNEFVTIIKYRKGDCNTISANFNRFIKDLHEEYQYISKKIDNKQYEKAFVKYGAPEYDKCYGYVPLLVLGGSEKVENLQMVKIKEHIALITQAAGRIE